jgi:hypothetical protein
VSKGKLSVVIVFALVLANIQCAAFCAVESCSGGGIASTPLAGGPPCHQHHHAPSKQAPASSPCGHQVVVQADAAQAPVMPVLTASVVVMDLPAGSLDGFPSLPDVEALAASAPSPPGLSILSTVVLRI